VRDRLLHGGVFRAANIYSGSFAGTHERLLTGTESSDGTVAVLTTSGG